MRLATACPPSNMPAIEHEELTPAAGVAKGIEICPAMRDPIGRIALAMDPKGPALRMPLPPKPGRMN
jgi:hypothetical protein